MYPSPFTKWRWPEKGLGSSKPKTAQLSERTSTAEPSSCPPTNESAEIFDVLPASISDGISILRPEESTARFYEFLARELTTPRLACIHDHLWLAGLTRPARLLHRQCLLKRDIIITEDPNEHLVWKEAQIFIKPLPPYLFRNRFWETYLLPTGDGSALELSSNSTSDRNKHSSVQKVSANKEQLYKSACGILLSYTWLINHPSDLRIAHSIGLIPPSITWTRWNVYKNDLLDHFKGETEQYIDQRYAFGELRLTRLSLIYRVLPRVTSPRHFIYGFISMSTWYQEYFKTHFSLLIAMFAYFTVVLSAMQVGLATDRLKQNVSFQKVSLIVTILSIVAVIVMIVAILSIWGLLFVYSIISTWKFVNNSQEETQRKLREKHASSRKTSSIFHQPEDQV